MPCPIGEGVNQESRSKTTGQHDTSVGIGMPLLCALMYRKYFSNKV